MQPRKKSWYVRVFVASGDDCRSHGGGTRVPATIRAITNAIRWAEEILTEIERTLSLKSSGQHLRRFLTCIWADSSTQLLWSFHEQSPGFDIKVRGGLSHTNDT